MENNYYEILYSSQSGDPDQPNYRDADYANKYEPLWQKCHDLFNGLYDRVVKARYLPQKPMESSESYRHRVDVSIMDDDFRQAILDNAGLLSKFELLPETPPEITEYLDNIDLLGNSLDAFLQESDIQALLFDAVVLMIDRAPDGNVETEGEAIAAGIERRPHAVIVPITHIFGEPLIEISNGRSRILSLTVMRWGKEVEGQFGARKYREYWRYTPGLAQVYREELDKPGAFSAVAEYPVLDADGLPLDEVPAVWYSVSNARPFMPSAPPLMALAERCLWQFRQQSELDDTLDLINHPTPVREWPHDPPNPAPDLVLGKGAVIEASSGSKVYPFEIQGAGVSLTNERIKESRQVAKAIAHNFLGSDSGANKTAQQVRMEAASAGATLAGITVRKESAVQRLFELWMQFATPERDRPDAVGGIKVVDNPLAPEPESTEVKAVIDAFISGLISEEYALMKLKEIGWQPESFNLEEYLQSRAATRQQGQLTPMAIASTEQILGEPDDV